VSRSIYWRIVIPFLSVVLAAVVIASVGAISLVWVLSAAALAVIGISFLISRSIARPVKRLTAAVRQMATGELDHQTDIGTTDELGVLGRVLEEMAAGMKQTMATLSEEKGRLATVLSTMTDGVIVTEAAGNVVLANPAAGRLCSFEGASVQGRPLIEVIHDHEIDAAVRECQTTGMGRDIQLDSAGGRFLRAIVVPLQTGKAAGVLTILQDLTEMRSLQTMRREFVGNVSHELRTPLAAIKAIVETLQDGAIEDRPAAMDFLAKVDAEVDGMTQMVNELIELSRVETGKAELNLQPADLNRIVEEVIARLSPQAERAGIALSADLNRNLPRVLADRDRIHQITANIVHNALKFTPSGGKVTVYTRPESDSVVVSVADTGIGISKQDLPHIFERFFKADRSRSTSGTGLGLAIAKHVVQAHSGRIWVRSEEGKGATFSFSLPLQGDSKTSHPVLTNP